MSRRWIYFGLALALGVGALLSLLASPWPDGLERVAEDQGFRRPAAKEPLVRSPIPEYLFPGVADRRLATAMAGAAGTLLLFALGFGLGRLGKGRRAWRGRAGQKRPG